MPEHETDLTALGPLLRFYRERAKMSRNMMCHQAFCDPSYGTRIEAGDRDPPRRHIVEGFARVLRLSGPERNRLLVAAGYAPTSVVQIGAWTDALQAVTEVQTDLLLTPKEKAEFEQVIVTICNRWHPVEVQA